jgi:hypothetical protein
VRSCLVNGEVRPAELLATLSLATDLDAIDSKVEVDVRCAANAMLICRLRKPATTSTGGTSRS